MIFNSRRRTQKLHRSGAFLPLPRPDEHAMTALRSRLEQNLGWFFLILLAAGCLFVMLPFVSALLWAAVLAFSSWPLYQRLLNAVGNRRTLAALLMTLALMLVILLPFIIVGV